MAVIGWEETVHMHAHGRWSSPRSTLHAMTHLALNQ
jgi:hypothetical protein